MATCGREDFCMTNARPKILGPGEGDARWFLGTLATIKVDGEDSAGRLAVFESLLPKDAAPPLHKHPEDETFFVLDGQLTVWVGGKSGHLSAGSLMYAPGGVPHTFLVKSETARVLVLSTPAGIERFIRGLSEPAKRPELPPDDVFPSDEEIVAGFAAGHVEICGPRPTTA
jgi:quercetin dioxygenase-like cupin family protein